MVAKPHNGGQWTAARFHSFIKSALRSASMRWPPKSAVKKAARLERGIYECAGYKRKPHKVTATLPPPKGKKRRIDNAVVDHKIPVVPPTGFDSWDSVIARLFCEADGLQVLCNACHNKKTEEEREARRGAKRGK